LPRFGPLQIFSPSDWLLLRCLSGAGWQSRPDIQFPGPGSFTRIHDVRRSVRGSAV
jgi:hypothetical protein